MRESIKASQECLNRIKAGETTGGAHSSGNGKGVCIIDEVGALTAGGDPIVVLGADAEKVVIGI